MSLPQSRAHAERIADQFPAKEPLAMERPLMLLAGLTMAIALATTGCRSCSSNYDYSPPVANCYCDACGTHRCGSNSSGCATGECGAGGCATGGCSTCGPTTGGEEYVGGYENGEMMEQGN